MKVGDYVRTKKGILKIRDDKPFKDDKNKLNYLTYGNYTCVLKEDIIKSSPNIIDLIEVEDYVNGMLVIEETPKDKRKKQQIIVDSTAFEWGTERFFNEDIKSIVTKEQFESMEYKVGE